MKALLIAALFFTQPVMAMNAFEFETAKHWLKEVNYTCTTGEWTDGQKVDDDAIKEACLETVRVLHQLHDAGYCFDKATKEWAFCQ